MGNKTVMGFAVANPTVTGTNTGITAKVDKASAVKGETVKVTVTLDATATATSVTVSATNATVTPAAAQTVAAGHSYTFEAVLDGQGAPVITVSAS